jgi:hypothetical protein
VTRALDDSRRPAGNASRGYVDVRIGRGLRLEQASMAQGALEGKRVRALRDLVLAL